MPFRPGGGGGSTPHDILSTVHPDSDPADVPAVADVLTWTGTEWEAQPGGAPGAHVIDGAAHTGTLGLGDGQFPAPAAGYPVNVAATEDDGVSTIPARDDHRHAHGTGYLVDAHHDETHDHDGTPTPQLLAANTHGSPSADTHHATDHDHDGAPTQQLLAANTHGTPSPNTHHNQAHDLDGADHTIAGEVAGEFLRATAATSFAMEAVPFSAGATVLVPAAATIVMVWRAPFACTVTNVRGHRKGGTGATINARRNQASDHLSSDLSLTSADAWMDGGAVQNTAYVAGDDLEIEIATVAGSPTEVAVQVDFTRP